MAVDAEFDRPDFKALGTLWVSDTVACGKEIFGLTVVVVNVGISTIILACVSSLPGPETQLNVVVLHDGKGSILRRSIKCIRAHVSSQNQAL